MIQHQPITLQVLMEKDRTRETGEIEVVGAEELQEDEDLADKEEIEEEEEQEEALDLELGTNSKIDPKTGIAKFARHVDMTHCSAAQNSLNISPEETM